MTVLTSSAFSTLKEDDVVERDGIGSVQAEHDEVRFLADFERSDLRLHVQHARASDRGHPSACSALKRNRISARHLLQLGSQVLFFDHTEIVVAPCRME
jgi:hypothetical protein